MPSSQTASHLMKAISGLGEWCLHRSSLITSVCSSHRRGLLPVPSSQTASHLMKAISGLGEWCLHKSLRYPAPSPALNIDTCRCCRVETVGVGEEGAEGRSVCVCVCVWLGWGGKGAQIHGRYCLSVVLML